MKHKQQHLEAELEQQEANLDQDAVLEPERAGKDPEAIPCPG